LLPPNLAPPANWPVQTAHVRASAEPSLNAWAAKSWATPRASSARAILNPQTKRVEAEKYSRSPNSTSPRSTCSTRMRCAGCAVRRHRTTFPLSRGSRKAAGSADEQRDVELTTERIAALSATDLALGRVLRSQSRARSVSPIAPLAASDLPAERPDAAGLDLATSPAAQTRARTRSATASTHSPPCSRRPLPMPTRSAMRCCRSHTSLRGALSNDGARPRCQVTNAAPSSQAILKEADARRTDHAT
jgi:hypothetical protein